MGVHRPGEACVVFAVGEACVAVALGARLHDKEGMEEASSTYLELASSTYLELASST